MLAALIIHALWHILVARKLQAIRAVSRTEFWLGALTFAGVVLVDIQTPSAPRIVDYRAFPVFGGHSLQSFDKDGQTLLLLTVTNMVHAASFYAFLGIDETPLGPKLRVLSLYEHEASLVRNAATLSGTHDGYIAKHPATGEWIAYLAYAAAGFVLVNVDDPTRPRTLGHWDDFAALNRYVARVQSILQRGKPDNDILLYWPLADVWENPDGLMLQLGVHDVKWITEQPVGKLALALMNRGYTFDYISDAQLQQTKVEEGALVTPGARL